MSKFKTVIFCLLSTIAGTIAGIMAGYAWACYHHQVFA